jgi:hypothetical protein
MRNQVAKALARKPRMQMKSRWLDFERRRQAVFEVEGDCMVWRWADRRRDAEKLRERRPMHMTGGHKARARMLSQDIGERSSIAQILHVHVVDSGHERRVVQKYQGRPC